MSMWQISCKREAGDDMELMVFHRLWRVILWLLRHLKSYRVTVIIRIEE